MKLLLTLFAIFALANADCQVCKTVVSTLQSLSSQFGDEQVLAQAKKVCFFLPSAQKAHCHALIEEHGKPALENIRSGLSNEHICQSACRVATPEDDCGPCQLLVGNIEALLEQNSTVTEIEDYIVSLCSFLPASLADVCDEVAYNYIPEVIEYIENDEPASVVCAQLGFCTSEAQKITPAPKLGGEECTICEYIVSAAEAYLANNHTEDELEDFLNTICTYIPSEYQQECSDLVYSELPELIEYIENNEDASVVCAQIGVCTSEEKKTVLPKVQADGEICQVCEFVISAAESYLAQNSTDQDLEAFLDNLCDLLPSSYQQECTDLVNDEIPELIEYIENNEPADVLCAQIGVCSSTATKPKKTELPKVSDDDELCQVCEFVISAAESYLAQNSTDQDLEAFLDNLCDILPSAYQQECMDIVNDEVPELIEYIENEEPADVLCAQIGLCSSPTPEDVVEEPSKVQASTCSICELVVSAAEEYLSKNHTVSELEYYLNDFCDLLPSSYQQECTDLVDSYLPEIVQYLEQSYSADVICQDLGLCTSNAPNDTTNKH